MWYCCSDIVRWQKAAVYVRIAFKLDFIMFSVNQIKFVQKQCQISSHSYTPDLWHTGWGNHIPSGASAKLAVVAFNFSSELLHVLIHAGREIYGCSLALTQPLVEMLSVELALGSLHNVLGHHHSALHVQGCQWITMMSVYMSAKQDL